jgi:hypothetical protein
MEKSENGHLDSSRLVWSHFRPNQEPEIRPHRFTPCTETPNFCVVVAPPDLPLQLGIGYGGDGWVHAVIAVFERVYGVGLRLLPRLSESFFEVTITALQLLLSFSDTRFKIKTKYLKNLD